VAEFKCRSSTISSRSFLSISFKLLIQVAYHINPFVKTVAKGINDEGICKIIQDKGRYGEESPLYLKNDIQLFCEEMGWRIVLSNGYSLSKHLIAEFDLETLDENIAYLLKDNDKYDRIQIAVEFARKVKEEDRRRTSCALAENREQEKGHEEEIN